MKAATGELNLTVITIIAIALIATFLTMTLLPNATRTINNQWNTISGEE